MKPEFPLTWPRIIVHEIMTGRFALLGTKIVTIKNAFGGARIAEALGLDCVWFGVLVVFLFHVTGSPFPFDSFLAGLVYVSSIVLSHGILAR